MAIIIYLCTIRLFITVRFAQAQLIRLFFAALEVEWGPCVWNCRTICAQVLAH